MVQHCSASSFPGLKGVLVGKQPFCWVDLIHDHQKYHQHFHIWFFRSSGEEYLLMSSRVLFTCCLFDFLQACEDGLQGNWSRDARMRWIGID